MEHQRILAINFIFNFLWTGGGFSVSSLAFLGFHGLKLIEKYGHKGELCELATRNTI